MTQTALTSKTPPLSPADLGTVLSAWEETTLRLEQTHKALREEVKRLTDELEIKNRDLARKNRLADLGQMAAHVAHEVRNNLVPVTLYLSLLRRRILGDCENLNLLDKISAGFTALDATVNDLLHFTAERDPHLKTFKLKKLIEDVCSSLSPQFEAQGIEIILDISPAQTITADFAIDTFAVSFTSGGNGALTGRQHSRGRAASPVGRQVLRLHVGSEAGGADGRPLMWCPAGKVLYHERAGARGVQRTGPARPFGSIP